ncbi:hemin uptake protein HemP [Polycyclovorans algicola]|uniref:hemin uptake protein HemP n=1 Tax=Polycyclovorans algicola TaxID=616992 RepID=UPI0004A6E90B|nr:hemin uptake protein HemP [Polycyclovorans algicola]
MTPFADAAPQLNSATARPRPAASNDPRPRLRSESLFRDGQSEVLIDHGDQCYRLRLTRQGKLLLHK